MRQGFYIFLGIFLILYGLVNYYVGFRGWQMVFSRVGWLPSWLYWTVFWGVSMAYIVGRMGRSWLSPVVGEYITLVGAYWLAILYYLILGWLLIDLVRLLNRWIGFIPQSITSHPAYLFTLGMVVILTVTGLVGYGHWNARHPQVKNYTIDIPKSGGNLKELHLVAVSDLHLGEIMDVQRLRVMVNMIHELQPDVVMMPGDVIDEDVGPFIKQKMADLFKELQPKYGIIAVPGNHEYIGGQGEKVIQNLRQSGITVLRNSSVLVADSVYVIGRDDLSAVSFGGEERPALANILQAVDKSKPLILLDHQPKDLSEAEAQGIDLQLSGHTHGGQFWPNNYITQKIYEIDWGYLRKGSLQAVVSLGFGTWGPPIRVGNTPELVNITVRFK